MRNQVLVAAAVILGLVLQPAWAQQAAPTADDLAAGIRQVEEGDLEAAVVTLDGVVRRLAQEKGREKDLATAHLYLAMTHLGLSQWERAKGEMREAWRNDRQLALDPKKFPPRLIQLYEQTRQETAAEAAAKPTPAPSNQAAAAKPTPAASPQAAAGKPSPAPTPRPATPAVASQPAPAKKGGGSKALWIGLGVAAAGGGVAAAAGGGGGSTPSTTPTPAPTPTPTDLRGTWRGNWTFDVYDFGRFNSTCTIPIVIEIQQASGNSISGFFREEGGACGSTSQGQYSFPLSGTAASGQIEMSFSWSGNCPPLRFTGTYAQASMSGSESWSCETATFTTSHSNGRWSATR